MEERMKRHIESFEKDCEHCIDLIKAPMLRIYPYPESPADKERRKVMEKIIDYKYAQIKGSKVLRTPFGVLIWTPRPSHKEKK